MSGLKGLCEAIFKDLEKRLPFQRLTQRRKLSELVSAVLMCQSPNLMELSNVLDRPTDSVEARYNYVERFLKNPLVNHMVVMRAYAEELLRRLSEHVHTLVLMIDQSKVNDRLEVLMVSVRVGKRALPLYWICKETKGGIGFKEQEVVLDVVRSWLPEGVRVMLAGDRFYGSCELIRWCQKHQWQYRLRLKGNLMMYQNSGDEKSLHQLHCEGIRSIEKARMRMGVVTSIGFLHEKGHKEPWYIAMDCKPSKYRTLDYGMRWGIENMFSDFKTRGFSLMDSQLRLADRLERLLLVLSIAFHWAVSVGLFCKKKEATQTNNVKQKRPKDRVSLFLNAVYVNSDSISLWIQNHRLYGHIQTDGC